jgi:hypothetical protein
VDVERRHERVHRPHASRERFARDAKAERKPGQTRPIHRPSHSSNAVRSPSLHLSQRLTTSSRAHYHLATNLECNPFVVPTALIRDKFTPDHKPRMRGIDSPLWIATGSFAEKLPTSGLHPYTACVLDWMSFLTAQIRSSVLNDASEARYPQIMLSTTRIYAQLAELPSAMDPLHDAMGDFVYEAVRLASLVYTRAIMQRIKLSQACSPDALAELLEATSRVPLRKWKEMPGIWLFILLVANAGARFTREGRLSRALTRICSFSISLRDWQAMVNLMESFLAVQKWIAERGEREIMAI